MSAREGYGGTAPRRFLIATAVANYRRSPAGNLPGLADARRKIVDLFTRRLGYVHVSDLGLDPDRDTLLEQLDRFATDPDRRPDDLVAVYLAGHGQLIGATPRRHVFFPADADLDKPKLALPTAQIAAALIDDTKITQLLLMLDTCHAGQGGGDAVAASLESLRRDIDGDPAGIAVVSAAQPAQQALEGAFPDLLTAAVESVSLAGERPPTIDLGALVTHMNADPARPPTQRVEWDAARLTGTVPDFFPNPRHRAGPRGVDLAIQHAVEWGAEDRRRDVEFNRRMLVRAMAHFGDDERWRFAGRRRAVAEIMEWLAGPAIEQADPERPALVVTAGPGSGKTALLGLIAALCHPEHRLTVPLNTLGLTPVSVPRAGAIDLTLYAQSLTDDEVLRGLAAAARTTAATPGELLDALAGRDRPFTVLIDALDEAATPDTLLTRLIRPLLEHGRGRLRFLLGTRPHLLRHLPAEVTAIDLDGSEHRDPRALREYALSGLLDSNPASPYRDCPMPLNARVADAVAAAAEPSFLVARIVAGTLAAAPEPADPDDPVWRAGLPGTADAAMARDLDRRLGPDAARARDLLRPLACAEGQGLPWEDIWAPLASALAGRRYTDADLLWLRRNAGAYVVEATEDGRSVYRLYHMALAEHLRRDQDEDAVRDAFADALTATVPYGPGGVRDWARAHPYVLRHLSTHTADTADTGRIDALLEDAGFLSAAAPEQLLRALRRTTTERGRTLASIYRTSAARHAPLSVADRRLILAVDALRHQETVLAERLAGDHPWRLRWTTAAQISPALRAVLAGHQGGTRDIACIEIDGVPVAVSGGMDGTVRVWDLTTYEERCAYAVGAAVNSVDCALVDGRPLAATASLEGMIRVWDLRSGEALATFEERNARTVDFSIADGWTALVIGDGDRLRVREWPSGRVRHEMRPQIPGVDAVVCTVVNGAPVVVAHTEYVGVWDPRTGIEFAGFAADYLSRSLTTAEVAGVPVAVGYDGDRLQLWDLTGRGRNREVATGDRQIPLTALAAGSRLGSTLAICGENEGPVSLWDLTGDTGPRRLSGHTRAVRCAVFTEVAGEPVVVTGGADTEIRVWDPRRAAPDEERSGHACAVESVALVVHDGRALVATGADDGLLVRDLSTGEPVARFDAGSPSHGTLRCSVVDGRLIGIGAEHYFGPLRVHDPLSGASLGVLPTDGDRQIGYTCVAVRGRLAVIARHGLSLIARDLETGSTTALRRDWPLHGCDPVGVRINDRSAVVLAAPFVPGRRPDHLELVKGISLRQVTVWYPDTGEERICAGDPFDRVRALAVTETAQGSFAACATRTGQIRVWDLASAGLRADCAVSAAWTGGALACRVTPEAVVVATGGENRVVRLLDATTGAELGHWPVPHPVGALAFGPDGEIVVATGHEVLVLDVNSPSRHIN
ncbi:caspase family protein [Streptomyces sp. NPDC020875]|uniref:caspase family protein n=1 Tax=Streptomyces sp. NPDC020875 TaxID=3154898 RepID=UPI0033F8C8FD